MRFFERLHLGERYILAGTFSYSIFPVLVNYSVGFLPPIFFAAVSTLGAAVLLLVYLIVTQQFPFHVPRIAWKYILGVTVFVVILPSILIYTGTQFTSSVNTAILLKTEVIFAIIICGLFFNEKITRNKLLGAVIALSGAYLVITQGTFRGNTGDLLIVLAAALYPFGNMAAKKAFPLVPAAMILFLRSFIGGAILLFISVLFESSVRTGSVLDMPHSSWMLITLNAAVPFFIAKLFWYEGMKRIEISQSIALSLAGPAFSLVLAFLFLKEIPSLYQMAGFVIITAGLLVLTRKPDGTISELETA